MVSRSWSDAIAIILGVGRLDFRQLDSALADTTPDAFSFTDQTDVRGGTLSAGQLIDIVKWNLLRHIPVKMRGGRR